MPGQEYVVVVPRRCCWIFSSGVTGWCLRATGPLNIAWNIIGILIWFFQPWFATFERCIDVSHIFFSGLGKASINLSSMHWTPTSAKRLALTQFGDPGCKLHQNNRTRLRARAWIHRNSCIQFFKNHICTNDIRKGPPNDHFDRAGIMMINRWI